MLINFTNLLFKEWKWDKIMEKAFGTLKSVFIFILVLYLFDPFKKIVIEINTFNYALRVIFFKKALIRNSTPLPFIPKNLYRWK